MTKRKLFKYSWWLVFAIVMLYMLAFESRSLRQSDKIFWLEKKAKITTNAGGNKNNKIEAIASDASGRSAVSIFKPCLSLISVENIL